MSRIIRVVGPKEYSPKKQLPTMDENGSLLIDTTSRGSYYMLSPFHLGPVDLWGGHTSFNVENAWQYSKVYRNHIDGVSIKPEFFSWAKAGWNKKRADRYPMGRGTKPMFSYWDGDRLGYIEARKKIYVPLYTSCVIHTVVFRLLNIYTENITLWDFDGYDNNKLGMSLDDVLNDPKRKMGHAFVLAMILEGVYV